jgi:PhnB protein
VTTPVPEEFGGCTPHIVVTAVDEAVDFYRRAFGADELVRTHSPDGRIWHCEILVAGSRVLLLEEYPEVGLAAPVRLGLTPVMLHLYVPDADAVFARAVAAGGEAVMRPWDAFWGDRYCQVKDPSGHLWAIASRREDLSVDEVRRRSADYIAQHPNAPRTDTAPPA